MSYEPQAGTIPSKAIEWLKAMEKAQPGVKVEPSTYELCEALDVDPGGFVTCMSRSLAAGLVRSRKIVGRGKGFFWSLGDGKPIKKPFDMENEAPLHRVRVCIRPGPLFPGVNAAPPMRTMEFEDMVIVTGVQIVDGAAVFTREQFQALTQGARA